MMRPGSEDHRQMLITELRQTRELEARGIEGAPEHAAQLVTWLRTGFELGWPLSTEPPKLARRECK